MERVENLKSRYKTNLKLIFISTSFSGNLFGYLWKRLAGLFPQFVHSFSVSSFGKTLPRQRGAAYLFPTGHVENI
ncbi:MAG: hypothetical protein CMH56_02115 [Myxococcales bacterium]|nr:hypothetical protein [Myxococcales bacterium]